MFAAKDARGPKRTIAPAFAPNRLGGRC